MQRRQSRARRSAGGTSDPGMPALSAAFDHPDDAARYVHAKIGNRRDKEYGGFILLRRDKRYVATEPIPGKVFFFDPNDVFPRNDEEGYVVYPAGHDDYAIYHSHPTAFAGLHHWPENEKATYPNSFSTGDIYALINERDLSPASYLSGPDGSLIKYTVSDSAAEKALFKRVSGPVEEPQAADRSEIHQALQAGTMLPSDFVRLVAAAGDLQVIEGSELWGKPGKVQVGWKPYPQKTPGVQTVRVCDAASEGQRLVLSPAFKTADDAARYVHKKIAGMSHSEILGFLLKHPETGTFRAAEPIIGADSVNARCTVFHPDPFYRPRLPSGYRVDGLYFAPDTHSQVGQSVQKEHDLQVNFFQPEDLNRAFDYRYIPAKRPKGLPVRYGFTISELYFLAPDGALLGYTPSKSAAEYELARRVSVTYSGTQSIQKLLKAGGLMPSDFVRRVTGAGQLRVLEVSRTWPEPGSISSI